MSTNHNSMSIRHKREREERNEQNTKGRTQPREFGQTTCVQPATRTDSVPTTPPRTAAGASVGAQLRRRLLFDTAAEESLQTALQRLREEFPDAEIEAFVDYEGAESADGDVRIVVSDDFNDLESILTCEDTVQSIVRSAEVGETMLYTSVRRSNGD